MDETRQAAVNGMNHATELGRTDDYALETALNWASECFDRAFGRERIRMAGINLDEHPRWRSYQAFYDDDLPPPSHAEAADHIIKMLGTGVTG